MTFCRERMELMAQVTRMVVQYSKAVGHMAENVGQWAHEDFIGCAEMVARRREAIREAKIRVKDHIRAHNCGGMTPMIEKATE